MLRKLIVGIIVANFVFILASVIGTRVSELTDFAVASNHTKIYTAGATVPQFLELNAQLHPMIWNSQTQTWEPDWNTNASSLAFGTLSELTTGVLWGNTSYAAVFYPATSGRKYEIAWSGAALDGPSGSKIGSTQTPSTEDAYLVVPDYQMQDLWDPNNQNSQQGSCPGKVEPINKVASGGKVYTSDSAGLSRILRAYVGITGVPGPLDNPDFKWKNYSKGYNGSVPDPAGTKQEYSEGTAWDVVTKNQPAGSYSGSVTFTLNTI